MNKRIQISIRNKQLSNIKSTLYKEFESVCKDINEDSSNDASINELDKINQTMIQNGFSITKVFEPKRDDNWLGLYSPMKSPGVIRFNKIQILGLSTRILYENVKNYGHSFRKSDPKKIIDTVFLMILHHELFHYYCDLLIYNKSHKATAFIPKEEALAVACSFILAENRFMGPNQKFHFQELFYENLKSPGYKDWKNYNNYEDSFPAGVIEYLDQWGGYSNTYINIEKYSFINRFYIHFRTVISKPNVKFELF
jgi:hypothetical protein